MKGKVFGLIVLTAIAIGVMSKFGWLGGEKTIELKAHYVPYACGDSSIDMKVSAVNDSTFTYLIGKSISPEAIFDQTKLSMFVNSKLDIESDKSLKNFIVVGHIRKSKTKHCSGSVCFSVKKIKFGSENTFLEF